MKRINIIYLIIFTTSVFSQNVTIDNYIKIGLQNNLALKQKQFSLEQSISDLNDARGMFFPTIEINARYSRAGGGRTFDIPIGDLVNPIHFGLNSLNPNFNYPTNVPNGVTRFLREKEHETKISIIQPIIQPALFYNYSIKNNLMDIQTAEKEIYTRKLIADIKVAYSNYLKSEKVKELYNSVLQLLQENLRVSKSLFNNNKITVDVVYRAKAELSEIEQKKIEAEKNLEIARSYFNFLIGRKMDILIESDSISTDYFTEIDETSLENIALKNRGELSQVNLAIETAKDSKGLSQTNNYPGISLAVDYGFQGEDYKFTSDDDYWMASLVLNWNLFNGFRDNAKTEKADIETKKLETQLRETQNLIRLQVKEAYKNLIVAKKTVEATEQRAVSYLKSFNIIKKKYSEGMISQLEYLDAQNSYIRSEVEKIIAKYRLADEYSKLENVSAIVDLEKYK